ncbi:transposase [Azoarcus communis SWub3 = DSM 12120]|nr:transposase [Parazoarcus communis SWub3 = DSM 12120]
MITTLTDSTRYSAAELADLYRQRWDVELNRPGFRGGRLV